MPFTLEAVQLPGFAWPTQQLADLEASLIKLLLMAAACKADQLLISEFDLQSCMGRERVDRPPDQSGLVRCYLGLPGCIKQRLHAQLSLVEKHVEKLGLGGCPEFEHI